mgnify:FL=1
MTNIVYRGSCEGLQEQAFLNHVSKLINNDPRCKNKVYFDLINVGGGDPLEVVKKAVNYNFIGKKEFIKNKRVIALFDYDFKDSKFLAALKLASDNKIIPFYTITNFDLLLINLKEKYTKQVSKSEEYIKKVRKVYHLDSEANIKNQTVIDKILKQITLDDIIFLIKNAKIIEKDNLNSKNYYSAKENILNQPNLLPYMILEEVLYKAGLIERNN